MVGETMDRESRPGVGQCPNCGGELVWQPVEKLLRGGVNVAVVTVPAEVCRRCGEWLFHIDAVRRFEQIRGQLARQETAGFEPMGQAYQVAW